MRTRRAEQSFDATGTSHAPPTPLASGVHYWRVRSPGATAYGPTWQFVVGARSAGDTSWGSTFDYNRDGFADLVTTDQADHVYLYAGSAAGLAATPTVINGPATGANNASVANVGDVDGDGYPDMALAGDNVFQVYAGGPAGFVAAPSTVHGPAGETFFGQIVAGVGDLNGDGYADVAASVPADPAVYVFFGSARGLGATFVTLPVSNQLPSGGDLNDDGYSDLVLGTPGAGAAVYLGSATGLAATPLRVTSTANGFGIWATDSTDVNGDGFADLLIGQISPPAISVYPGGATFVAGTPVVLAAPSGSMAFGTHFLDAGDTNGDGYGDIVAGTYVLQGSATGLAATPIVLFDADGATVDMNPTAGIGDTNGDGFAEVALLASSPRSLDVYRGAAAGIDPVPALVLMGPGSAMQFGGSFARAFPARGRDRRGARAGWCRGWVC